MEFEQIFYSPSLIIYACVKGNIKSNFETVYVNKKLEVNVVNTKEFPETIVAVYPSFIFLKNSKIELPKYITKKPLYTTSNTLKTNYINLFSRVFEKNYQVIFKLEGYLNVSPKMIFKQIQAFKSYKDIANVKKIVDEFINIQPKIETARDWYNNVKKYCPMFDYKKQIDDAAPFQEILAVDRGGTVPFDPGGLVREGAAELLEREQRSLVERAVVVVQQPAAPAVGEEIACDRDSFLEGLFLAVHEQLSEAESRFAVSRVCETPVELDGSDCTPGGFQITGCLPGFARTHGLLPVVKGSCLQF